MDIYIRYLQMTVMLTNAVLYYTYIYYCSVHYSYLNNTGRTGDIEGGIWTQDVAPRERGWGNTAQYG